MTLTPTIVNSTLVLKTTFTVGHTGVSHPDTVVITDLSNWSSIVSSSTDKVNIILQVLDSGGQVVYQNNGWNTANFASPDLFFGASPVTSTPSYTLLYDTNGALLTGTFTVNAQVQVIQNFSTSPLITLGSGQTTPLLNYQYLQGTAQGNINPVIVFTPNYPYANMTVADGTAYGAYASITRSITVTPPVQAMQSPFTAASNSVLVTNLWSPAPYQGQINNIVYYQTGNTYTVSYINYYQNFDSVNDTSFCELYCCLKSLFSKMQYYNGRNTTEYELLQARYQAGSEIYILCELALACSDTASIPAYVEQFYQATGCSPDCDCGCSDTPSPIIPVVPTQGPAGPTGATGPSGANGTNGTNGTNGSSLLWVPNVLPQYAWNGTTGTGGANFVSNTILANKLQVTGDSIEFTINTTVPAKAHGFIEMAIGNGSPVAIPIVIQGITTNTAYCVSKVYIQYIGSNLIQVNVSQQYSIPSSTIAVGWEQEHKFDYDTSDPTQFQLTYNPTIDGIFVLYFSNASAACGVSFIEAVLKKI